MIRTFLALALFSTHILASEELSPEARQQLARGLNRLEEQQRALDDEIRGLKKLLGVGDSLESFKPIDADPKMDEAVRALTEEGKQAFVKTEYEASKTAFQKAWEKSPDQAVTNYNLGLVYYKQGNHPLARRMLKQAIELRSTLDTEGKIAAYLAGEVNATVHKEPSETDKKRTQLTNLKNEADSYLKSQALDLPKKRSKVSAVLNEMITLIDSDNSLIQEYYSDIADHFTALEQYDRALQLLATYQASMKDKLLPDNFYSKQQNIEQRAEALKATLEGYLNNTLDDRKIARRIERDQEELAIFAAQIDRFVQQMSDEDGDFRKICSRLKEYHWGGRTGRHVLVVTKHQELLYSSLEGTLALDRYQDDKGQPFLKNITLLADRLAFKQTEFFEVALTVRGEKVPYLVLFTFIPKQDAFIIVRMPKKDII